MTNSFHSGKPSLPLAGFIFLLVSFYVASGQSPDCGNTLPSSATLAELSGAIKANPEDPKAYFDRGMALSIARRYTQALKDFKRAVELDPKFADAFSVRAYLYAQLANYKRSVEEATRALEIDPQAKSALSYRGYANMMANNLTAATDDLSKAIELERDDYFLYRDRARAFLKLGKSKEALADLDKEIDLLNQRIERPENALCSADYYRDRGVVRRYFDQYAEAENDLILAKQIDPQNSEVYFYLGQVYLHRNAYDYAIDAFSRSIELIPESAMGYEYRARAYDAVREKEKAAADRKKYDELSNPKEQPSTIAKPKTDTPVAKTPPSK